jgi:hypothetical protein
MMYTGRTYDALVFAATIESDAAEKTITWCTTHSEGPTYENRKHD